MMHRTARESAEYRLRACSRRREMASEQLNDRDQGVMVESAPFRTLAPIERLP